MFKNIEHVHFFFMESNVANSLFRPTTIKSTKITYHKKVKKPRSLFNECGFKFQPLKLEQELGLEQEFNDNGYAQKITQKLKEVTATKSKIREAINFINGTMTVFDAHIRTIIDYLFSDTDASRTLQARAEILSNLMKQYPHLIEPTYKIFAGRNDFTILSQDTIKAEDIKFKQIESKLEVFFITFKNDGCNYVIDFINKLLQIEKPSNDNQINDLLNVYYFFLKYCSESFAKNKVSGYDEIFEKLGPISKQGKKGNSLAGTYNDIIKNNSNFMKYNGID